MRYILVLLPVLSILSVVYLKSQVDEDEGSRINLANYEIVYSSPIDKIAENLSGITFSPDSSTLFAVVNNPEEIIELSKRGEIIRKIGMNNFHDTEGIAHIVGNEFAIVHETSRTISIINIADEATDLDAKAFRRFNINPSKIHNKGLEGVAWSASSGLYVANEHSPNEVIHLPESLFNLRFSIDDGNIMPHYFKDLPIDDISGLHFSEFDQQLFVLSHESRSLLAVNKQGEVGSRFNFDRFPFGFGQSIIQPEGITVDKNNNIYVVGEPNIFMILAPKT